MSTTNIARIILERDSGSILEYSVCLSVRISVCPSFCLFVYICLNVHCLAEYRTVVKYCMMPCSCRQYKMVRRVH